MSFGLDPASLTKAFSPTVIGSGQTTRLTWTLTNNNAVGGVVSFTDTLPAGLRVAATPNIGGTCSNVASAVAVAGSGTQVVATGVQLPAGGSGSSCTIGVDVTNVVNGGVPQLNPSCTSPPNPVDFTNGSTNITGLSGANNAVTPQCVVVTAPTLSKAFSPVAIANGGTATLTFTLTNPAGAPAANNVSFTDTLPAGLRVAATSNVGGSCANAVAATSAAPLGSSIAVSNLQVPAGGGCTVSVDVTNADGQVGSCPASALTNGAGNIGGLANVVNGVSDRCLTVNAANLVLAKTNNVAAIDAGGTTTYVLTVTNNGAAPTSGTIAVVDVLPAGLSIAAGTVSLSGANAGDWSCTASGQNIACTSSAVIAAGGGSVFGFTAGVSSNIGGLIAPAVSVTNRAKVGGGGDLTGNTAAPTPAETQNCTGADTPAGCAVDTDTIVERVALAVDKDDGADFYRPGITRSYTILVTNAGPADARNATVQDDLPTGVTLTGPVTCAASGGAVCGTLSGGASGQTSFTLTGNRIPPPINGAGGGLLTITVPVEFAGNLTTDPLVNTARVLDPNDPDCNSLGSTAARCTNADSNRLQQTATAIPLNTPWGLLLMAMTLALLGLRATRRLTQR